MTTLQQPLTRLIHRLKNPSNQSVCPPWQGPQIRNCRELHLSATHAPSGAPDEAMETPTGKLVWVVKDVSRLSALREAVLEKAEEVSAELGVRGAV